MGSPYRNLIQCSVQSGFLNSVLGESLPLHKQWSPTEKIKSEIANSETRIQSLTGEIENKNAYYIGRCVGDMAVGVGGVLEIYGDFRYQ